MIRRPPRSTRTDTLFPSRRSSDLSGALSENHVGNGDAFVEACAKPLLEAQAILARDGDDPGTIGPQECAVGKEAASHDRIAPELALPDASVGYCLGIMLDVDAVGGSAAKRSEENTSEIQSLMRNSYA